MNARWRYQRGQGMAEFFIGMPIVLLLILGAFQFALVYQAKTVLNLAALQAARSGALHQADPGWLQTGLQRGLTPLYTHGTSASALLAGRAQATADLARFAHIRVLNPTPAAFADFGQSNAQQHIELPNDSLSYRLTSVGTRSGESIQDANLLKVRVTYGAPLIVPFVNWLIVKLMTALPMRWSPVELAYLKVGRLPIVAQVIVRMQSPALQSQAMSNGIPGAGNSAGNPGNGNGNPPGNGNSTPGTANGGNVPPIGPPGDSCPLLANYP